MSGCFGPCKSGFKISVLNLMWLIFGESWKSHLSLVPTSLVTLLPDANESTSSLRPLLSFNKEQWFIPPLKVIILGAELLFLAWKTTYCDKNPVIVMHLANVDTVLINADSTLQTLNTLQMFTLTLQDSSESLAVWMNLSLTWQPVWALGEGGMRPNASFDFGLQYPF